MEPETVTDVLIVGTGPAGASLAAFLSTYQVKATLVSYQSSTTSEARAHMINPGTFECLRDVGVEDECRLLASDYRDMPLYRHCHTVTGREYRRGKHTLAGRTTDCIAASPCIHRDLPQNLLEPILVKKATQNGIKVRFDTEFISYVELSSEDGSDVIISTCRDCQSQRIFTIKSRYLCSAEGGRSKIVQDIGATLRGPQLEASTAYSIYFKADLSRVMSRAPTLIQYLIQPDREFRPHCMAAIIRTVRPWDQFQFNAFPLPTVEPLKDLNEVNWTEIILQYLGDPSIDIKITGRRKWRVNEVSADFYSKGNVFCLGDAVHRHPPMNGLGQNTAIQDAYNLAWKLAYVLRGLARPSLLNSYNSERQPVGEQVVLRANDSFRLDLDNYLKLGLFFPNLSERKQHFDSLSSSSAIGSQLRTALNDAFAATRYQYCAIGAEMNQWYRNSHAIYLTDESDAVQTTGPIYHDKDWDYEQDTIPGMRLPHAWLIKAEADVSEPISLHDLAGNGRFTLFTGIGGKAFWTSAVTTALATFDSTIASFKPESAATMTNKINGSSPPPDQDSVLAVHSIGFMGTSDEVDFADTSLTWGNVRGVEDSGAVLVRPDRFVCWRCRSKDEVGGADGSTAEAAKKLHRILASVLGWSTGLPNGI